MATRSIDIGQASGLLKQLGADLRNKALGRGVRSFAARAKPLMVLATDKARSANPKGLGVGAVDTANYRRRWKTEVTTSNGLPAALIVNDAPYAGVIEYGRRAGQRAPPSRVLEPWVRRKLGVPAKAAPGVAFLIARSIKRRGLKPRYVLTARSQTNKLEKAFKEEILREMIAAARGLV